MAVEGRPDAGALAEVRDLAGQGGDEPVVVEGGGRRVRASVNSSSIAWVASVWISLSSSAVRAARRARGLQPQQDRGQGLVHFVVQVLGDAVALLLLGADDGAAALHALLLEAGEHPVEVGGQALDLGRRLWGRLARWPGEAGSTPLHGLIRHSSGTSRRLSRIVLSSTAPTTTASADQDDALDRRGVAGALRSQDGGDDRRRGDEAGVDRQDLGEEGARAHLSAPFIGSCGSGEYPISPALHFVEC